MVGKEKRNTLKMIGLDIKGSVPFPFCIFGLDRLVMVSLNTLFVSCIHVQKLLVC